MTSTVTAVEATDASTQRPKLVLFYSPRSGKTRRVEGYLAQVLQRRHNHDTFTLVRVNTDARPDLASRFRIDEVPTLVVIAGNRTRARLTQPRGCIDITQTLRPWLK